MSLSLPRAGDYLSLDSVLAEEEYVVVLTSTPLENVGRLYAGNQMETEQIESGTKVEVGWWMAKELLRLGLCALHVPLAFSSRGNFKEALQADPTSVSLRKHPYFYALAKEVALMPELGTIEQETFLETVWGRRWVKLLDESFSVACEAPKARRNWSSLTPVDDSVYCELEKTRRYYR